MENAGKLLCQRISCNAMFTEDDNPEGSCTYHASPLFHDGIKEWSCCKKRSHDFNLFLEIPGCKVGKHTTEKPVPAKPAAAVPKPIPTSNATVPLPKEACLRCRQGFFCSEHVKVVNPNLPSPIESNTNVQESLAAPAEKKRVDINQPQICKNKGCGKTFKEKDNHETACSYHPGPPIFHDRMRGWKCCDVHAKEFDEFMTIPPCAKGWHNADPAS